MTAQKNIPALRFPEFEEEWQDNKLSRLLTIKYGKDYKHLNSGSIPVYGTGGVMTYVDEYLYNKPSVLIGRKGTIDKPKFIDEPFWTVDTMFYSEINSEYEPYFVYLIAANVNWLRYNEATGVPSLNTKSINSVDVYSPISKIEQQKIADFLSAVDERIQQLTRKKELLEQYKKGVMQQLFSQQIRFKDDDGNDYPDWEEKRLGEVFDERTERAGEYEYDLLSVSINDGVQLKSNTAKTDNSSSDKSKYKLVLENDIVYNSMRMWQGASGVSKQSGITSPAYTVLAPKLNVNSNFYSYYFKLSPIIKLFERNSQGLTSDTWNLKYPAFSQIVLLTTSSVEEQTKIADFLSDLDNKISSVQTEIEQTQLYKKGLLQQMFC